MLANESIVPAISLIRLPIRHPPSFRARHALDRCHAWNERERAKWRRDTPSGGGKKRKREEEGKWNGESQARVEKLETDTEDSDELILELARAGQIRQNCGERDEIPSGQGVDQLSFFFFFFFRFLSTDISTNRTNRVTIEINLQVFDPTCFATFFNKTLNTE